MKGAYACSAAVLIFMALLAAACEGANSQTSMQSGTAGKDENLKAFTLSVSYWEERKDWSAAVERTFKQTYPNATIEWRKYEGDKYVNGLLTSQFTADQAADIIINQSPAAFGKGGYVVDLTDMPFARDEFESLKKQDLYEGKVYGVPLEAVTTGVFYNKTIFADLGIAEPQNWSQFIAANDKIKAAHITPLLVGAMDSWTANIVGVTISNSVVYAMDPGFDKKLYDGAKKFHGTELTKAMKMVEQLAVNGYFNKDAFSIGYDELRRQFADGKGAMVINGNWFLGDMAEEGELPFEIGYFPIRDENGKAVLASGGDKKVSINAKSPNIEKAKELAAIMFDKRLLPLYLKAANSFPAVAGVTVSYDEPAMGTIAGLLKELPSGRQIGGYWPGSTNTKFGDMIARTIADRKWNPADLDEMQQMYDADKSFLVNTPD